MYALYNFALYYFEFLELQVKIIVEKNGEKNSILVLNFVQTTKGNSFSNFKILYNSVNVVSFGLKFRI